MQVKTKFWRVTALLMTLSLLFAAFAPVGATPQAPSGAVPVPASELAEIAAMVQPEQVPPGLGTTRAVPLGLRADVASIAAAGETMVPVVVYLDKAPLADVARDFSPEQRVAYAAEVAAMQDQVAAQVEAQGGRVVGRFTTLSSGLAAEISGYSASKVAGIPGVVRLARMNDYEVDLSETVPWIGAADLQKMGLTGKNVDVAVIDSGIDFTHKAFGGPGTVDAWKAAWFGSDPACKTGAEIQCAARQMPNPALFGPTAPKVVGGWDFIGDAWISGKPAIPDPNPIDADYTAPRTGGHGTHVADIIGGLPFTGKGAGVAPDARLWAFRVCSATTTSCSGLGMALAMDAAADLDRNPATYDPADVANMSIGSLYGQPEDDSFWFANQLAAYGTVVAVSAGNSADKPYIVGSPSSADGTLSVAQTTVPSNKQYLLTIDSPASIAGLLNEPVWLDWSVSLAAVGAVSGTVQYGNADGTNKLGCDPFKDSLAGKVALVDRGTCSASIKAANASAAGAKIVLIGMIAPGPGYPFAYGGGVVTIPAFSITQADATKLKGKLAEGVVISAGPDKFIGLADTMVSTSSRGPRNNDSRIKPDIGAPGGSVSALSGAGTGTGAFGGTSGASPMVAGSAALLAGFFGDQAAQAAAVPPMPIAQFIKILLMNSANNQVYMDGAKAAGGGGTLAPITRIGAGQVNVGKAYQTRIIAWDSTDARNLLSLTGSLSFGYQPVAETYVATRTLTIMNLHPLGVNVWFSSAFRYASDVGKGVTVTPLFQGAYIPGGGTFTLPVLLTVDASALRTWTSSAPNKGSNGASSAALTTFEYDGYITIANCDGAKTGCYGESITVPWHVLPKKIAEPGVKGGDAASVTLQNMAPAAASNTDIFALVDQSANLYGFEVGNCRSLGTGPGCNVSPVDIKEVGVRDWNYDLMGTGSPQTYVEFAVTIWDKPYRSSQMPAMFEVDIDSNKDGKVDYAVYNLDGGDLPSPMAAAWFIFTKLRRRRHRPTSTWTRPSTPRTGF